MFLRQDLSTRLVSGAVAAVAATAMLAGCSGSQPQLTPQGFSQTSKAAVTHSSIVPNASCPSKGGVSVTPCRVLLNASNPGPVALTVKTPNGSKSKLKEHDLCGALGIATISGSGDSWTVTAGSNTGTCRATFAYFNNGNKVGWARAIIDNQL